MPRVAVARLPHRAAPCHDGIAGPAELQALLLQLEGSDGVHTANVLAVTLARLASYAHEAQRRVRIVKDQCMVRCPLASAAWPALTPLAGARRSWHRAGRPAWTG